MSAINFVNEPELLTLTATVELDAAVEDVWQLWANPRLLERWWGPPTYPATFVDHDLTPGGRISYYMTGPDGEEPHGWWRVLEVEPNRRIELEDGFADEQGKPDPDMPMTLMVVTFQQVDDGRTTMVISSTFPSAEAMQQLVDMGMEDGMREALDQIDALLGL